MATYIKGYIGRDDYISAARPLKIGAAMPLYASGNAIRNSGIAAKTAALPLADAWPLAAGLSLLYWVPREAAMPLALEYLFL